MSDWLSDPDFIIYLAFGGAAVASLVALILGGIILIGSVWRERE